MVSPAGKKRLWPRILLAILGLIALLLLVLLLAVATPPGRESVLGLALGHASDRLPGELEVSGADWPRPGRLRLEMLRWIDEGDTLLVVGRLDLDLDIRALTKRRLHLRDLTLHGLKLDLPLLQVRLATKSEVESPEISEPFLLDPDSLLIGLPDLAVDALHIEGQSLRLAPELELVDVLVHATARIATDGLGQLHLDSLRLAESTELWSLEQGHLTVELKPFAFQGQIGARLRRLSAQLEFNGVLEDSVRLSLSPLLLDTLTTKISDLPTGKLVLSPDLKSLHWSDLGIRGLLGDLDCSGSLSAGTALQLDLQGRWPRSPLPGLRALLPDSLAPERFVKVWPDDAPSLDANLALVNLATPTGALEAELLLPGIDLSLAGPFSPENLDLTAHLQMRDLSFAADMLPALDGTEAEISLDLRAHGAPRNPVFDLELEGAASGPAFTLPALKASLHDRGDHRLLELHAAEGLSFGSLVQDSLRLRLELPADSLTALPLSLALHTQGELLGLDLALGLSREDGVFHVAGNRMDLRLLDRGLSSSTPFTLSSDPVAARHQLEDLSLQGGLGWVRAAGELNPDSLALAASADLSISAELMARLLPPELHPKNEKLAPSLVAELQLAGPPSAPDLDLDIHLALADSVEGRSLGLGLELGWRQGGEAGLEGVLHLGDETGEFLTGRLDLPGYLDSRGPTWLLPEGEKLGLNIGPDRVDLARFGSYLPSGLEIQGYCDLELEAEGRLDSLGLSGRMNMDELLLRWDRLSWISLDAELAVSGSNHRPALSGRVETHSGQVHLPPPPPVLLPTKGEALLWSSADSVAGEAGEPAAARRQGPPLPDLDLQLLVPGELFLRGNGLELELGGELRILREPGDAATAPPRLHGAFGFRDGSYDFLGRRFDLERGEATFFGGEEPDPALDVVLASQIGDNRVRILLGGRASEPVLRLESDPERSEGEIMGLILSGGESDEETATGEQLQDAGATLLAALGSSALRNNLARRSGLDRVEYQAGEEGEAGSLLLAKYLHPRLLMQYELGLEESSDFVLHLRYLLNRHWKIETNYSQQGDSGLELFWSRED